ncbi:hypothetical protein [Halomarina pelagica]|uniref:hypothetical protein n=1 Tax=Halomarina pelagica TaxID=2961599 RepID=UPI0020C44204|nr:hypothetical protein [Halomarina sp. BND7]
MPTFDVEPTTIHVFEIDDTYHFAQFFDDWELFNQLKQYYNREKYRFDVPSDEVKHVQELLEPFYYELEVVEEFEAYCVVKKQYTNHAAILKQSVEHWTRDGHHFFLMKDPQAVEFAVEQGATPITDTEFVLDS